MTEAAQVKATCEAISDQPHKGGQRPMKKEKNRVLTSYSEKCASRIFVAREGLASMTGYIIAQASRLGPWLADTPEIAQALLQQVLPLSFDRSLTVITSKSNQAAQLLLKQAGFLPERCWQSMTHPQYGHFRFGNVFGGTLEEMLAAQKLVDMNAHIQRGVSRCRASCQYFAFCGGGAPSNKLWENNAFDSTETMRCKLGKQAIVDAVLDHLESRYALSSAHNVSPLERSMRLREWVKGGIADEVLSAATVSFTFDDGPDDDFRDWFGI
jgi:radical SAM protein with 4Fe4S-binding SPASM domain